MLLIPLFLTPVLSWQAIFGLAIVVGFSEKPPTCINVANPLPWILGIGLVAFWIRFNATPLDAFGSRMRPLLQTNKRLLLPLSVHPFLPNAGTNHTPNSK